MSYRRDVEDRMDNPNLLRDLGINQPKEGALSEAATQTVMLQDAPWDAIDYSLIYEFAQRTRVSYNELCATVRASMRSAITTPAAPAVVHMTFDQWLDEPNPIAPSRSRRECFSARVIADFKTGWDAANDQARQTQAQAGEPKTLPMPASDSQLADVKDRAMGKLAAPASVPAVSEPSDIINAIIRDCCEADADSSSPDAICIHVDELRTILGHWIASTSGESGK